MTVAAVPCMYAVVLNPQAGGGAAARAWPSLRVELEARGLPYVLIQEPSGEAALARVKALEADVAVLAVGGDGTVGALLPAIVGTGRPLGILPLGTGNDFAGMLRLRPGQLGPALDRLRYAPRLVDALEVTIEAGEQQGRHAVLLNGLGMGFDAQVAATMASAPSRLQGFSRYAWAALVTVRELSLTPVTITMDGALLYDGPSALVAVMNGTRYGGGFQISPDSDVRDGLINVLASRNVTRLGLIDLMGRVLRGRHLNHPLVRAGVGKEVVVSWASPVDLHLDGDLAGKVLRLRARVLPASVTLLNA